VTFKQDCNGGFYGEWGCPECDYSISFNSSAPIGPATVNTAGSLSRMAFSGNTLYVIGSSRLSTYKLSNGILSNVDHQGGRWGMETVIVRGENLYIGAQDGMHIYSLSTTGIPSYLSSFIHFTGCDPVAVEGDTAVVTLRDGRGCGGQAENVMFVLDISDKLRPQELVEVPLSNPRGVALHNGIIYVCDHTAGLRVYELAGEINRLGEREIQQVSDLQMQDVAVLPYERQLTLLTIGENHLSQFAIDDAGMLEPVSSILATVCNEP
jgi:hypothetical protein